MQSRRYRPWGSGSLFERHGAWYGQWRANGRTIKRKLGPKRKPGTRDGLTKAQAEARLRDLMRDVAPPPPRERVTVADAGTHYIDALEAKGRKRSTLQDYRSYLRHHLAPAFGSKALATIDANAVEAFIGAQRRKGLAPKSIRLHLSLLHGIFEYARSPKRQWAVANPVAGADKPEPPDRDGDIRWLDDDELEALLRAVPDDDLGRMEWTLYLTAAMTGLRQGELRALRWRDIDWPAMRVRVRQNIVRGKIDTPKSRRGVRAVPLASRVAGGLERHFKRSAYQADDDLVFAHPATGSPYDRSRLLKRFKAALRRAKVREVTFHDLRHTFGTRMAAAGVPLRTLMEWMGHRDYQTVLIYADYQPGARDAELVERAFGRASSGHHSEDKSSNSEQLSTPEIAVEQPA